MTSPGQQRLDCAAAGLQQSGLCAGVEKKKKQKDGKESGLDASVPPRARQRGGTAHDSVPWRVPAVYAVVSDLYFRQTACGISLARADGVAGGRKSAGACAPLFAATAAGIWKRQDILHYVPAPPARL